MKCFIVLVFIFLCSFQSFSQKKWPGYVILNNGDTLRGDIKRTSPFNDKPAFTVYNGSEKEQKILEIEAQEFSWVKNNEQELYTRFKVRYPLQPYAFLKIILKGKISVFESYIWVGNVKHIEFYFKTADDNISMLDFADRFNKKKKLRELLADCPLVAEKIKGSITPEKALKYIEEYNNCEATKAN